MMPMGVSRSRMIQRPSKKALVSAGIAVALAGLAVFVWSSLRPSGPGDVYRTFFLPETAVVPDATVAIGATVARFVGIGLRYGKTVALDGITLDVPAGRMVGIIGPDGVGESSLLSLLAGARVVQSGSLEALGGDTADARPRAGVASTS